MAPGGNGVWKLTDCAGRQGSVFGSRPAHRSPDVRLARKSAVSGDIVRGIREPGFRGVVRISSGGGLSGSGGAFPKVSVARFGQRFPAKTGRKLSDCADPREPAFESRLAHKSPDVGPTRKSGVSGGGVGEIRKSGFRDVVRGSWGVYQISAARFPASPSRILG